VKTANSAAFISVTIRARFAASQGDIPLLTTNEIREQFLKYFESKNHRRVINFRLRYKWDWQFIAKTYSSEVSIILS